MEALTALTPQDGRIAYFACDGLSNPEIGDRLFVSQRTEENHLHNVFTKLGIRSCAELSRRAPQRHARSAAGLAALLRLGRSLGSH